ncbi:MAG TPA: diguanylate cyclase [Armatimonadetes bacterium]|nr:diguanylate cyclase [Armatimonadota bacterium]
MSHTRILVVEDEESMLTLLEYTLRRAGYEVATARNGLEGLERVKRVLPDAIVADVSMPEMDGLEMCRHLREDPETETIPFIFLSARGQLFEKIKGLEIGADDYVPKPFERSELLARVEAVLRRAETYRRIARIDQLTRLGNRDYFEQRLQEELYREQRYGISVSLALVMIDLEEVEAIRRQFGSAAGDLLVRSVAQLLRTNVRALDVPARYDDRVFVVLMPHTSSDKALIAVNRIRQRLAELQVDHNGQPLRISANFGVSVAEGHVEDMHQVIQRAQQAMLEARKRGRDAVYVWPGERNKNNQSTDQSTDQRDDHGQNPHRR